MEIVLSAVRKRYGDVEVVKGLDLLLPSGKVVALLGPSGCGKTTTLRMIAGLERITGGSLSIGGRVVDDGAGVFVPPEQRGLGMVFQSYALWPHKSVLENVAYPLSLLGLPSAQRQEKAMAALRRVRLEHLATRMPHQLSGGQQQRVAVARAVVGNGDRAPPVLLLDEPLANLDARLREDMRGELSQLARDSGATVVAVTHDQQEAFAIADHVVVLDGGVIAQDGSPDDLYQRPCSAFVGAFGGPMSFVDGALGSDGSVTVGATVVAADAVVLGDNVTVGDVMVGVRPEWLSIRAATDAGAPENAAVATIARRLFLGREYELSLALHVEDRDPGAGPSLQGTWSSVTVAPAMGATVHVGLQKVAVFPKRIAQ